MTDKRALRARCRAVRDAFVLEHAPVLAPHPDVVARFTPGQIVASYVPVGAEADPSRLVAAARDAGCQVALPWVRDKATPIRFLLWNAGAPLEQGPFGLRQPASSAPEVAPDLVLTPLVAFDRYCNRLGQGAGHYDRAFAAYPGAWRLGLAWSVQQVDDLPVDPWDVPLHAILTDDGLLTRN